MAQWKSLSADLNRVQLATECSCEEEAEAVQKEEGGEQGGVTTDYWLQLILWISVSLLLPALRQY